MMQARYRAAPPRPTRRGAGRAPRPRAHAGFSLVELMIALVIGLIILVAVAQIFLGSRATFQYDQGIATIQENARFALGFLANDLREAGNLGCMRSTPVINNLNPGAGTNFSPGTGIEGYEANGTAPGGPVYPEVLPFTNTANAGSWTSMAPDPLANYMPPAGVLPGNDIIVVQHISGNPIPLSLPYNDTANFFVAAGTPASDFPLGAVMVASDCASSTVFQVTNYSTASGTVVHSNAAQTPGNRCARWGPPSNCPFVQYGPGTQAYTVETDVYYVAADTNGVPTLYRVVYGGNGAANPLPPPQPLVSGVENMQVLYGVDTVDPAGQPSGTADEYLTAAQVPANLWPNVVSARIGLLVSTINKAGRYKDLKSYNVNGTQIAPPVNDIGVRRQVFTTTIKLRNRGN